MNAQTGVGGIETRARRAVTGASLIPRSLTPLLEAPTLVYMAGVGIGVGSGALVLLLLLGALEA